MQDLGESSVDGSMADFTHPSAMGHSEPADSSMFADVQKYFVTTIGEYPIVAIGLAAATGVMLGCLVKRR